MRRTVLLFAILLSVVLVRAAAAGPRYSEDPGPVFWFVAVADSHVGEALTGGDQDTKNLGWVTGEMFQVVQPRFLFLCGDLVDGTNGGLIPTGQHEAEWTQYRSLVDAAGMKPEFYVDLPGNHDQYSDKGLTHYLKYSVSGSTDGQTQHSVVFSAPYGLYHFLAVSTAGNDGAVWPFDNDGLDEAEMLFAQEKLSLYDASAAAQFAFGHHPTKDGKQYAAFRDAMKTRHVRAYFFGHTHDFDETFRDGVLHVNVRALGKSDDRQVALAVVDNDSLAVRVFDARKWPYVLISAPADWDYAGGNPHAYSVPPSWKTAPVRAVVFSKNPPLGVEFQVDQMTWQPMAEVAPHLWQGAFDSSLLAQGKHELRVRPVAWPDKGHQIRFRVGPTACANGVDDDGDGKTDWPDDPGCVNPAGTDETDPPPNPEPVPDSAGEPIAEPCVEPAPEAEAVAAESGVEDGWASAEAAPTETVVEPDSADVVPDPGGLAAEEIADPLQADVPATVSPEPNEEADLLEGEAPPGEAGKTKLPGVGGGCREGQSGTGAPVAMIALFTCAWIVRRKTGDSR